MPPVANLVLMEQQG